MGLQQQSLIAIKLLSLQLAQDNPAAFRPTLEILSLIVKCYEKIPLIILAHSILCLAEVCANLRAHSISYLSKIMPRLGKILQVNIKNVHATPNIIIYLITAIYKIVESVPHFLSPYLVKLIVSLSKIWSKLQGHTTEDAQRKIAKLDMIWKKLANVLSLRILIPIIDQSYKRIIVENEDIEAIGPLMQLLADSLANLTGTEIVPFQNDLGSFFVIALQFRSDNGHLESNKIRKLEDHIINALVGLVLKLSESSFRPLYYKIYDWAIRSDESSIEQAITFYR